MARKIFLLIGIYILTTAHTGTIDYGDGWRYQSWEEEEASSVIPVFLLRHNFARAGWIDITCKKRHITIEIKFFNRDGVTTVIGLNTPILYSFDDELPTTITKFVLEEMFTLVKIEDQNTARNWLDKLPKSKRMQLEFRQQNGFAHVIEIDLSKWYIYADDFKEDCERPRD